jgi:hypothetical protein
MISHTNADISFCYWIIILVIMNYMFTATYIHKLLLAVLFFCALFSMLPVSLACLCLLSYSGFSNVYFNLPEIFWCTSSHHGIIFIRYPYTQQDIQNIEYLQKHLHFSMIIVVFFLSFRYLVSFSINFWTPRYSLTIVESGVKHHQTNKQTNKKIKRALCVIMNYMFTATYIENHWPVVSHWQTFLHNVVHLVLIEIRTHNISGDRH